MFETFPEGLALIRNGQIVFANKSLSQLLELNDYDDQLDPNYDQLRGMLGATEVSRLGSEQTFTSSIW